MSCFFTIIKTVGLSKWHFAIRTAILLVDGECMESILIKFTYLTDN